MNRFFPPIPPSTSRAFPEIAIKFVPVPARYTRCENMPHRDLTASCTTKSPTTVPVKVALVIVGVINAILVRVVNQVLTPEVVPTKIEPSI